MNKTIKSVTAAVSVIMIFVFLFTFLVSAAPSDYNAGVIGSDGNKTYKSAAILEKYLEETLSDSEKAFLDEFATFELSYDDIINTSKVDIAYDDGKLTVIAAKYSYITENGREFAWNPDYVNFNGQKYDFFDSNGDKKAEIITTEPADKSEIKVAYKSDTYISGSDLNLILNLYRNLTEYAEYTEDMALYDAYVFEVRIYEDLKAKYNAYLAAKAEYENLSYIYNNYDEVKKKFSEEYQLYNEYLAKLEGFEAENAKYQAYLEKYNAVRKQLDAVELIDVKMTSLERTIYSAVMGGTVDQVLARKNEIILAGVDEKDVDLAGEATERVRNLMKGYKACKTEEEKYAYYVQNYNDFCESFLLLTQKLDVLYRNVMVRGFIVAKGRNEKYIILVSQLALISNAFIDGEIRDSKGKIAYNSTWKIDGKTISEILGKNYFTDTDSGTPISTGYPKEVKKPDDIVVVEKPILPPRPDNPPEAPIAVKDPGEAPTAVAKPEIPEILKNTTPEYVKEKVLSIYRNLTDTEKSGYADEYRTSKVPTLRDYISDAGEAKLTFETAVIKKYGAKQVKVTFNARTKNEYQDYYSEYTINVDEFTPVTFEGKMTTIYEDGEGRHSFVGWKVKDDENAKLDLRLGFAEGEVVLEPMYELVPAYYDVIWVVDGIVYKTESVASNALPTPPTVTPTKADIGNKMYKFIGWKNGNGQTVDTFNSPVSNTVYTADFEEHYIVPLGLGKGAEIFDDGQNIVCDASASMEKTLNISELVKRISGKRSLTLITPFGELKFTISDVIDMNSCSLSYIKVDYWSDRKTAEYCVEFLDSEQNPIEKQFSVLVSFKCPITSMDNMVMTTGENENSANVPYEYSDSYVSFRATAGRKYILNKFEKTYNVIAIPNDLADLTVSRDYGKAGDEITVTVTPKKESVEITEISVTDPEGNVICSETENLSFSFNLTESDVNVVVKAKVKMYTVTFTANGKIISVLEIEHGAEVVPPTAPVINPDKEYSYKFTGWDKEIKPATEDVEYKAVYEKTALKNEDGAEVKPGTSPTLLRNIIYIAVAVVIFVVIGFVVWLITRKGPIDKILDDDDD